MNCSSVCVICAISPDVFSDIRKEERNKGPKELCIIDRAKWCLREEHWALRNGEKIQRVQMHPGKR